MIEEEKKNLIEEKIFFKRKRERPGSVMEFPSFSNKELFQSQEREDKDFHNLDEEEKFNQLEKI